MTRHTLRYTVEPRDEAILIFHLSGDLYGSDEGYAFQNEVRAKVAAGHRKIVIDLGEVRRIDSSGVGILVAVMWSCYQAGGALALASLPSTVEKVLGIAMLLDRMTHAGSVDEALTRLGESGRAD